MKELLLFLCFSALAVSCKKFEHQAVNDVPDCTFCHLADSLEGSYTGRMVEVKYTYIPSIPTYGYDTILDTIITVDVNRSFEGLNDYEDSLMFKFNCSHFHDEIFLSEESIQTGNFTPLGNNDLQKFTDDNRMLVNRTGYFQIWTNSYIEYDALNFVGFKDE